MSALEKIVTVMVLSRPQASIDVLFNNVGGLKCQLSGGEFRYVLDALIVNFFVFGSSCGFWIGILAPIAGSPARNVPTNGYSKRRVVSKRTCV